MRPALSTIVATTLFFAADASAAELWGGLHIGMTPTEVESALISRPGVKKVKLGKVRAGGLATMNVQTSWGAIRVAEERAEIVPLFLNNQLRAVVLNLHPMSQMSMKYCVQDAQATLRTISDLLALKYKVDDTAREQAFTDGVMRVTPSLTVEEGPSPSVVKSQPMGFLFHPAVQCQKKGQGNQSARLQLTYMSRVAAAGVDGAKNEADKERLKKALDNL